MDKFELKITPQGSAKERYEWALATVLEEIALIRVDRGVDDDVSHEESQEFLIDGVPSKVTLTSPTIDSWTVEVRPEGAGKPLKYEYDQRSPGVTLHLPGQDQKVVAIEVPQDVEGAGMLSSLHVILFEFNEAGTQ